MKRFTQRISLRLPHAVIGTQRVGKHNGWMRWITLGDIKNVSAVDVGDGHTLPLNVEVIFSLRRVL
jgi:hypothetical protein